VEIAARWGASLCVVHFKYAYYSGDEITKNDMGRHVAPMGEKVGTYRAFVVKTDGRRPLGRSKHRWDNNSKICLLEIGWEGE
jgi:hypothetical protein